MTVLKFIQLTTLDNKIVNCIMKIEVSNWSNATQKILLETLPSMYLEALFNMLRAPSRTSIRRLASFVSHLPVARWRARKGAGHTLREGGECVPSTFWGCLTGVGHNSKS